MSDFLNRAFLGQVLVTASLFVSALTFHMRTKVCGPFRSSVLHEVLLSLCHDIGKEDDIIMYTTGSISFIDSPRKEKDSFRLFVVVLNTCKL